MIILTKKNIYYTIGVIAMVLFTYTITKYNVNNTKIKEENAMATVALPTNNKVIVIDAGHGKPDERC